MKKGIERKIKTTTKQFLKYRNDFYFLHNYAYVLYMKRNKCTKYIIIYNILYMYTKIYIQ